jgi:hypothetical protein
LTTTWRLSCLIEGFAPVAAVVIDAAINALKALAGASAFRRTGTAAGSEPPSVGRAGLPAADSKV